MGILDWLRSIDWSKAGPELVWKALTVLLGFVGSWFLIFKRRLAAMQKLRQGDSDDVLFQAHMLHPTPGTSDVTLLFRNVAPRITLSLLYDNPIMREMAQELAEATSLRNPVLQTKGSAGFEILNDAFGWIAGHLAAAPFPRERWLFTMTCEDRAIVRKKCIRCFLIRATDLERFLDWDWCRDRVLVEKPWHWFRVIALHQVALEWRRERAAASAIHADDMPLVDDQDAHERVRELSAGIMTEDSPVGEPWRIPWSEHMASLKDLGLPLEAGVAPVIRPNAPPENFRRG